MGGGGRGGRSGRKLQKRGVPKPTATGVHLSEDLNLVPHALRESANQTAVLSFLSITDESDDRLKSIN